MGCGKVTDAVGSRREQARGTNPRVGGPPSAVGPSSSLLLFHLVVAGEDAGHPGTNEPASPRRTLCRPVASQMQFGTWIGKGAARPGAPKGLSWKQNEVNWYLLTELKHCSHLRGVYNMLFVSGCVGPPLPQLVTEPLCSLAPPADPCPAALVPLCSSRPPLHRSPQLTSLGGPCRSFSA